MKIIFQNPYIIPFLLLAALPLLLHLFARKRPPVYDFSSLEFIKKSVRSTIRLKRPKDIMLLIIRTLFVLFIVALFLKPLFFSSGKLASIGKSRNIVIIVDATASMRYLDGGQTRFSTACAEASEILSGLGRNDRANVVWLRLKPTGIYPGLSVNTAYLQERLSKAQPNSETGDPAGAWELALKMFEGQEGEKEICIISDFQKSQWENFQPRLSENIKVVTVKAGNGTASNQAVTKIFIEPDQPLTGENGRIHAEIRNYSAEARRCTVFFHMGEQRQSQNVTLPAWGSASSLFQFDGKEAGTYPLEISTGEDLFPEDNQRWAFLNIAPALRIAVLPGKGQETAKFWMRALKSLPWVNAEFADNEVFKHLKKYDIAMLAGWDETCTEEIKEFLANGGAVFCMPAEGSDIAGLNALTGGSESGTVLRENKTEPATLEINMPDDKVFRIFSDGSCGNPAGGKIYSRFAIKAGNSQQILMKYSDGVPAIARCRQKGTFYLWNIPLDGKSGAFEKRAQFLPLLGELLLDARPSAREAVKYYMPGERIQLELTPEMTGKEIKLMSPENSVCPCKMKINGNKSTLLSAPLEDCGIYQWKNGKNSVAENIVNFPSAESDLRGLTAEKISEFGVLSENGGGGIRLLNEGLELWPFLLAAAIALAGLEGLAMLWAEKK